MEQLKWGQINTEANGDFLDNLKLKDGENKLRIVTDPIVTFVHYCKTVDGKVKKLTCLGRNDCPVCKNYTSDNEKAQRVNVVYAIDRSDDKIKLFEFKAQVRNGIENLAKDEDFGNPIDYDVKIKKSGSGMQTEYAVIPGAKKSLAKEELTEIETLKPLAELYAPKTIEEIESYGLFCLADEHGDEEIPI